MLKLIKFPKPEASRVVLDALRRNRPCFRCGRVPCYQHIDSKADNATVRAQDARWKEAA